MRCPGEEFPLKAGKLRDGSDRPEDSESGRRSRVERETRLAFLQQNDAVVAAQVPPFAASSVVAVSMMLTDAYSNLGVPATIYEMAMATTAMQHEANYLMDSRR
jgi:hypothetical protein